MKRTVALNGCGKVGRALLNYWLEAAERPKISLIRRRHSQWRCDDGIAYSDIKRFLDEDYFPAQPLEPVSEILSCPFDVWFELTPSDLDQAEPTHDLLRQLLAAGRSLIMANKAPLAYDYLSLKQTADANGVLLGLSGVLGASLPSYAVGYYGTMGAEILELAGILNATTNFVLEKMEQGDSFRQAIDQAVALGIVEPDWQSDVTGKDSAMKLTILASVLLEKNVALDLTRVRGIDHLTPADMAREKSAGRRYKLIARYRDGLISVAPESVASHDLFYHITGSQKILWLKTRQLSDMSVINTQTTLAEVAASLQRDLVWLDRELTNRRL